MKKHRNFLIFYGLWLGAIIGVFLAFDGPTEEQLHTATKTKEVCAVLKRCDTEALFPKCDDKLCCAVEPDKGIPKHF